MVHSPTQYTDVWCQCNAGTWWLNALGYCAYNAGRSYRRQRGEKTVYLANFKYFLAAEVIWPSKADVSRVSPSSFVLTKGERSSLQVLDLFTSTQYIVPNFLFSLPHPFSGFRNLQLFLRITFSQVFVNVITSIDLFCCFSF